MTPRGTSRCGFFASSAAVVTASKQMNAKNTENAAGMIPRPTASRQPNGANGCQLCGLTNGSPMMTNSASTAILRMTSNEFVPADSRMPIASSAEKASTANAAIASKYDPGCTPTAPLAQTG